MLGHCIFLLLGPAAAWRPPAQNCSAEIPPAATSIDPLAFKGCSSLASLQIPASVASIGYRAFEGCSGLASLDIPGSVSSIDFAAFSGCSSLAAVRLPESVSSVGFAAFAGCTALASVRLPESLHTIGTYAFQNCSSLAALEIPASVASIGHSAFGGCSSLATIRIPESVASIGDYAFEGCGALATAEVPDNVVVGRQAFPPTTKISGAFVDEEGHFQRCQGWLQRHLIFLVAAALLAWVLLVSQAAAERQLVAAAMTAELLGSLQFLQVLGDVSCLPAALQGLVAAVRALRPEGMHAACAVQGEALMQSYSLPLLLLAGQGILFVVGLLRRGQDLEAKERARRHAAAWLVSLYWLFPTLLTAAYRPVFGLPTKEGTVLLSESLTAWLALLACQVGVPLLVVATARRPSMAAATAPLREEWRRSWVSLVLLRSTAMAILAAGERQLALAHAADMSWHFRMAVTAWGRHWELLSSETCMAAVCVLCAAVVYSALLPRCRPYQARFLTALDGAFFCSLLTSEATKFAFAGVVVALQGTRPWAEGEATVCMLVVEALLLLMAAAWVLLLLRAVYLWTCSTEERQPGGPRQGLGSFVADAEQAIISAPGRAPRSWNVRVGRDHDAQAAVLLGEGRPPMLERGQRYKLRFQDGGSEAAVDGAHLRFEGEPEYEFWSEAVKHDRRLQGFSFACVWAPDLAGDCRPAHSFRAWLDNESSQVAAEPDIDDELWSCYQRTLPWVRRRLAEGSRSEPARSAWFDFWAINVLRCWQDCQKLRFAYLEEPLEASQPQFLCEGKSFFVGASQKVELEWAQDQMGMAVEPIAANEFLGAKDEVLRITDGAIEAAGAAGTPQPLLKRRQAAMHRRLWYRRALLLLPLMPLALAALSMQRAAYFVACLCLAAALAAGLGAPRLFAGLPELLDGEPRRADDPFYEDLCARLEARGVPRCSQGAEGAARELVPLL